ncbi:hypothetical protein GpartN1_g2173.t1 [Galdieria partita]|uniref:Uncharacterized protein n=1 Tax=Galdieria partita TaxID=83374 RepID=A0A9C7PUW8_9RHOD|nr:hypothetical protein GpartN1_g2173.t1 [Galdieria partita]
MFPVAVVTGSNRGIGLGFCKALLQKNVHVIATARNSQKGSKVVSDLQKEGSNIRFFPLDLLCLESVQRFLLFLEDNYGRLDILVNSAAVCLQGSDIFALQESLQTNFWGLAYLTSQLFPFIERAGRSRILNVSSGDGELCFLSSSLSTEIQNCVTLHQLMDFSYGLCSSQTTFGYPALLKHIHGSQPFYKLSKALVNRFTQILDSMIPSYNDIVVNAVCPGDVDTAMADKNVKQLQSVKDAVEDMTWLLDLSNPSLPRGSFFRKHSQISW